MRGLAVMATMIIDIPAFFAGFAWRAVSRSFVDGKKCYNAILDSALKDYDDAKK